LRIERTLIACRCGGIADIGKDTGAGAEAPAPVSIARLLRLDRLATAHRTRIRT